jgi:hypothetical protein
MIRNIRPSSGNCAPTTLAWRSGAGGNIPLGPKRNIPRRGWIIRPSTWRQDPRPSGGGGESSGLLMSDHPPPSTQRWEDGRMGYKKGEPFSSSNQIWDSRRLSLSSIVLELKSRRSPSLANQITPYLENRRRRDRSIYLPKKFQDTHSFPYSFEKP